MRSVPFDNQRDGAINSIPGVKAREARGGCPSPGLYNAVHRSDLVSPQQEPVAHRNGLDRQLPPATAADGVVSEFLAGH